MIKKALLTLSILAVAALPAAAQDGPTPENWKNWLLGLNKSQYEVIQGGTWLVTLKECQKFKTVFGTCFANNSAAPYVIPEVPLGNTVPSEPYGAPFTVQEKDKPARNIFYRLASDEAVVTVVPRPPEAAYFGYQTYLFTRDRGKYPAGTATAGAAPGSNRLMTFASLGNAVNHEFIAQRLDQGASDSPWGKGTAVFITTPNRALYEALAADAGTNGLDAKWIFQEPIDDTIDIGTQPAADEFLSIFRYALPKEVGEAGLNGWQRRAKDDVLVFRVKKPGIKVNRYPPNTYVERRSNPEAAYRASLKDLADVLTAGMKKLEKGDMVTLPTYSTVWLNPGTSQPLGLAGIDCIANGRACLGDTQETDSYRWAKLGTLKGDDLAIMFGVNPVETNNAGYLSLAAYDQDTLCSASSVSQAAGFTVPNERMTLKGSAERLLKYLGVYDQANASLKKDLDKLYAVVFSRTCSEIKESCLEISEASLASSAKLTLTQRAYLAPHSTASGNPDVMVPPMVMFTAKP